MISAAAINLFFFLCTCIYTCLCQWCPSIMVRMNGQPFAPQLGRQIGQQSHHFQNLLWHVYHGAEMDRYIHISTFIFDTFIWILLVCVYLPVWMQAIIVFLLITQAMLKSLIFSRSIAMTAESNSKINDKIASNIIGECIHCDFEHSYPDELWQFYSWIKMRWMHVDESSPKIDWKEHHIGLCASLFWILLVFAMNYLLRNNYIHSSHQTIMHTAILIDAFLRASGHILEPVPPFIDGNEHFLHDNGFSFMIRLLRRGSVYPAIRLLFVGFISEYQGGLLFAFPQLFLHEFFARVLRPLEEKIAKEHYRHQAKSIRSKGWKSTVLTETMYKPFFKTH